MGGRAQANGAVSLAVVATCFINMGSERGAGHKEDDRKRKRQALQQFSSGHGVRLHLSKD
jgi:hypothetical protein